jgi:dihydrofolate reductase
MTQLNLIVACSQNRVIGMNGDMPWHIPAELQHFKHLTTACPVIMGRKTWDSILLRLGKPLPGRQSIVITHNSEWQASGATVVHDLPQAVAACGAAPLAWVIGGAQIYEQAMPFVAECHVTEIQANFEGDAWFSELDPTRWQEVARNKHSAQAPSGLAYDTVIYRQGT